MYSHRCSRLQRVHKRINIECLFIDCINLYKSPDIPIRSFDRKIRHLSWPVFTCTEMEYISITNMEVFYMRQRRFHIIIFGCLPPISLNNSNLADNYQSTSNLYYLNLNLSRHYVYFPHPPHYQNLKLIHAVDLSVICK